LNKFLKLHFYKQRSKGLMPWTFVCQNVLTLPVPSSLKVEENFKELFV